MQWNLVTDCVLLAAKTSDGQIERQIDLKIERQTDDCSEGDVVTEAGASFTSSLFFKPHWLCWGVMRNFNLHYDLSSFRFGFAAVHYFLRLHVIYSSASWIAAVTDAFGMRIAKSSTHSFSAIFFSPLAWGQEVVFEPRVVMYEYINVSVKRFGFKYLLLYLHFVILFFIYGTNKNNA